MRRLLLLAVLLAGCGAHAAPATVPAPKMASAQAFAAQPALVAGMSAFEVTIRTAAGAVLQTLTAPTAAVTCAPGTIPAAVTIAFLPTDLIKVVWNPDAATPGTVCTWIGPVAGSIGMVAGQSYTSTVLAISDQGVRSDASAASVPFGVASKPPTPANVRVIKGAP